MGSTSLGMVNQKLAYTRALLVQLQALPEANTGQRMARQALLDAGSFHLVCAYRHYLRELAEHYALTQVANINTENDLQQALLAQGKSPAELHELQELRHQRDSWLTQLHTSYEACWYLSDQKPAVHSAGRIQALDLEAAAAPVAMTEERLQGACRALEELIARQRESVTEW